MKKSYITYFEILLESEQQRFSIDDLIIGVSCEGKKLISLAC